MRSEPRFDASFDWKPGIPYDYFRWLRDNEPLAWHHDPVNPRLDLRLLFVTAVARR